MKTTHKVIASLVALLAACLLSAADSKPIARVIGILDIETDDPAGYATWMKEYNDIAKTKLNLDPYVRIYESVFDGRTSGRVRVVASASSVAELTKNAVALESDPAIARTLTHLRGLRKTGARVLYQAVHFEGVSEKGACNFNTLAVVNDEAAYLQAITRLRTIFDTVGLKDVKIAVYRVLAGRLEHTHRITISAPSSERLAAFLDLMASNPRVLEWLASCAPLRTVISNTTSREITK